MTKVVIAASIDAELKEKISKLLNEKSMKLSTLINSILWEFVKTNTPSENPL